MILGEIRRICIYAIEQRYEHLYEREIGIKCIWDEHKLITEKDYLRLTTETNFLRLNYAHVILPIYRILDYKFDIRSYIFKREIIEFCTVNVISVFFVRAISSEIKFKNWREIERWKKEKCKSIKCRGILDVLENWQKYQISERAR